MDDWMIAAIEQGLREEGVVLCDRLLDVQFLQGGQMFGAVRDVAWHVSGVGVVSIFDASIEFFPASGIAALTVPLDDPRCFAKIASAVKSIPPVKGQ